MYSSVATRTQHFFALKSATVQGNSHEPMPTLEQLGEGSGPEVWPQKPGQCLLSGVACDGLYFLAREESSIWIDNLYVREGAHLSI